MSTPHGPGDRPATAAQPDEPRAVADLPTTERSEPDVTAPDVPEPDVPEPDVPEPDVPEPDVPEPDVSAPPTPLGDADVAAPSPGPVSPSTGSVGLPSAAELLASSSVLPSAAPDRPADAPETGSATSASASTQGGDSPPEEASVAPVAPVAPAGAEVQALPSSASVDPVEQQPGPPAPATVDDPVVLDATGGHATDKPTNDGQATHGDGTAAEPDTAPPQVTGGGGEDATVRRSRLPLVAAVLVVALLAAGVGYLGVRLREGARTETARSDAVAASRDAARLLFSYDHKTLQDDFARGLAVTTGSFREEYARTTKEVVSEVATEYEAVVLADVVESAVIEASPSKVTTLVFLNQATTSTRVQGQQVDGSRVRMVLEEHDGRWLVSAVEAL